MVSCEWSHDEGVFGVDDTGYQTGREVRGDDQIASLFASCVCSLPVAPHLGRASWQSRAGYGDTKALES